MLFFIEVLSHVCFFTVFLTVFYVTYVGYIQQKSMVSEFVDLLRQSFQFLVILFPPNLINFIREIILGTQSDIDSILDNLVQQETGENQKILTPVFIGVFSGAIIGLFISFFVTAWYGYSVDELIITNLISLSFVAVTDFIIVALYGQFRMLDTQYLSGLFAVKASGGVPDCNVVENTLFKMFPQSWIQNLIKGFLQAEGQIVNQSDPRSPLLT
jgi:hypothetical protein